jgi:hypothetical protein
MAADTIIPDMLNSILPVLTPTERWQALKGFDTNFTVKHWFTLVAAAVLIILVVLLLWVSYKRKVEERKIDQKLFVDCAERIGLSGHERQILLQVVKKSGLKQSDTIFSMEDAFSRGAAKLVEESIATPQAADECERLRVDISFLREKLGFLPRNSTGLQAKSRKPSSRQIPIGKELHITASKTPRSVGVDSKVVKNDDMELTLKLKAPVTSKPGETWRGRFYFSGSVWEFDSSVVRCDGDVLVLNHSDSIRFINLRRFLRVPVNKQAFIARFPFARVLPPDTNSGQVASKKKRRLRSTSGGSWGLPKFVPAVVTELAGLSLCLDVSLEIKVGEKVLVIFKLDEQEKRNFSSRKAGKMPTSRVPARQGPKVVQAVGEVRHAKSVENGLSIAVELTALSDSEINELVCLTNTESPRVNTKKHDIFSPVSDEQGAERDIAEPATVRGA